MALWNIADWRLGSPKSRGVSYSVLSGSTPFQPIDIDAIAGLTVHFRADVGLTASVGEVTRIINTAPGRFGVFQTVAASRPITSSAFSSVTPIVPYFSAATTGARYFTDDSTGANTNHNITSAISPYEFHFFAVIRLESTGVFNANPFNARGLAGDVSANSNFMSFESTGSRMYLGDGAARTTTWLPYSTGTNYVAEGSVSNFFMSLSVNGGSPVTGSLTGAILANGTFLMGLPRSATPTTSDAHIAEFCLFSKSLDATTATNIRRTLGLRWGINVQPPDLYAIGRISNTALFQGPAGTGSLGGPDLTNGTGSWGVVARKISVESSAFTRVYDFGRYIANVSGYRMNIQDGTLPVNARQITTIVNSTPATQAQINNLFLQNSQLYSFGYGVSGSTLRNFLTGFGGAVSSSFTGYVQATMPLSFKGSSTVVDDIEVVSISFSPLPISASQWADWHQNCLSSTMEGGTTNRQLPGATYHWEAADWAGDGAVWTDRISGWQMVPTGTMVKRNIRGARWAG